MTLVCAPIKKWPSSCPVDLYEMTEKHAKFLYDAHQNLKFIDIDWQTPPSTETERLIVSYHHFQETPGDLDLILTQMKARHPRACYYKMVTFARSTLDALRMLHFQKRHPNVIGFCMGEKGTLTRILAPVMGCPIMYVPLTEDDKNAPGQLLWSELSTSYHFKRLNRQTQIYGLIGDPVWQSIGHLFHNDQFRQRQINAVYVKMCIAPEELAAFFEQIQEFPIQGLSVTAPLKELLFPFVKTVSKEGQKIGAVNTLVRTPRGLEASNTDSAAAADCLGNVQGQKIVILGAGGGAKAIAYKLIERSAQVTIVNRTAEKGKQLAKEIGCGFSETIPPYDVLVNATSSPEPIPNHRFIPGSTVMDIAIRTTSFLRKAEASGCQIVDGLPMYFHQALAQQAIWGSTHRLH